MRFLVFCSFSADEPVRPIDPSAWIQHSEAVRGMVFLKGFVFNGSIGFFAIVLTSSLEMSHSQ